MTKKLPVYLVIVLFCSLQALSPGYSQSSGEASGINAMSFNIRYDNPGDGKNAWANRKDIVAETIAFHRVDICGMQEALKHQIEDLAGLLPGYGWIGVGRTDGKTGGEYCPIFYNKARIEVLDSSTFWLSETPDEPGSKSWDSSLPRIVTWARLKDRRTDKTFWHFNTHFDHRGREARAKSAGLLLEQIQHISAGGPSFVTGDFNCPPGSPPYKILTSGREGLPGLRDVYLQFKRPYGGTQTFNGFSGESRPGSRIDYIFVNHSVGVGRFGTIAERWDGRFVSDHYPVLAEIRLEGDPKPEYDLFGCTIVMAARNGLVLAGNNEDRNHPETIVTILPATERFYGRIVFGYDDAPFQGGMNDRGLFIDGNRVDPTGWRPDPEKPTFRGSVMMYILGRCATCDDVRDFFNTYNHPSLERARFPVADKSGASMVVEFGRGKTQFITSDTWYLISTNFVASNITDGHIPCWRYRAADKLLSGAPELNLELIRETLEATHQKRGSLTVYSNICDLINMKIHIYNLSNFDKVVVMDLNEELKKGQRRIELPSLFSSND